MWSYCLLGIKFKSRKMKRVLEVMAVMVAYHCELLNATELHISHLRAVKMSSFILTVCAC